MKKRYLLQCISLVIAIFFSTTSIVSSAPDAYSFKINQSHGNVTQRYKSPQKKNLSKEEIQSDANPLIVHIQDAHESFDAQKNIAEIIKDICNANDDAIIGVEGAIDTVNTDSFRSFPLPNVRTRVAEEFVKEGIFTGSELAAISAIDPIQLKGLESKNLFVENFKAFYKVASKQSELEEEIMQLEDYLDQLRTPLYNNELNAFDSQARAYESNRADFMSYVGLIYQTAARHDIDLFDYISLIQFKEVFVLEQTVNTSELDRELSQLADLLKKEAEKKNLLSMNELTDRLHKYRLKQCSQKEIVQYVYAHALKNKIDIFEFANIKRAITYWRKIGNVDIGIVMDEALEAADTIRHALALTQQEHLLIETETRLRRLKHICALKAKRKDVLNFRKHRSHYDLNAILETIDKIAWHANIDLKTYTSTFDMDSHLQAVESFYRAAEDRDLVMVKNLIATMKKGASPLGILVAGGYHSDGIVRELKKEGISYVTVTPSIENITQKVAYMERMMGNVAPLNPQLISHLKRSNLVALLETIAEEGYLADILKAFNLEEEKEVLEDPTLAAQLVIANLNSTDSYKQSLAQKIYEQAAKLAQYADEESAEQTDSHITNARSQAALDAAVERVAQLFFQTRGNEIKPTLYEQMGVEEKTVDVARAPPERLRTLVVELEKERDAIQKEAIVDRLTHLLNRNGYDYFAPRLIQHAKRDLRRKLQYVLIDIDEFGAVNNLFGHAMGDEVLEALGELLNENIRPTDKAFRYGGEEIVVMFPEVEVEDVIKRLEFLSDIAWNKLAFKLTPQRKAKMYESIGGLTDPKDIGKIRDAILYQMRIQNINNLHGVNENNETVSLSYESIVAMSAKTFLEQFVEFRLADNFTTYRITFSAGVTPHQATDSADTLMSHADEVLYEAKKNKLTERVFNANDKAPRSNVRIYERIPGEKDDSAIHPGSGALQKDPIRPQTVDESLWHAYINDLRIQIAELTELARVDTLTELLNRNAYEEILDAEINYAARHADRRLQYIIIDIDHFGGLNDIFTHEAGDDVLAFIGKVIKKHIRPKDKAFRYGGEELVILMPGAPAQAAVDRIRQMQEELGQHIFEKLNVREKVRAEMQRVLNDPTAQISEKIFSAILYQLQSLGIERQNTWSKEKPMQFARDVLGYLDDGTFNTWVVSLSAGVAAYEFGMDTETLKARADNALYAAKRQGRARIVVADNSGTIEIPKNMRSNEWNETLSESIKKLNETLNYEVQRGIYSASEIAEVRSVISDALEALFDFDRRYPLPGYHDAVNHIFGSVQPIIETLIAAGVSAHTLKLAAVAQLFHDLGYGVEVEVDGKAYTTRLGNNTYNHEDRSISEAYRLLPKIGIVAPEDQDAIAFMIASTKFASPVRGEKGAVAIMNARLLWMPDESAQKPQVISVEELPNREDILLASRALATFDVYKCETNFIEVTKKLRREFIGDLIYRMQSMNAVEREAYNFQTNGQFENDVAMLEKLMLDDGDDQMTMNEVDELLQRIQTYKGVDARGNGILNLVKTKDGSSRAFALMPFMYEPATSSAALQITGTGTFIDFVVEPRIKELDMLIYLENYYRSQGRANPFAEAYQNNLAIITAFTEAVKNLSERDSEAAQEMSVADYDRLVESEYARLTDQVILREKKVEGITVATSLSDLSLQQDAQLGALEIIQLVSLEEWEVMVRLLRTMQDNGYGLLELFMNNNGKLIVAKQLSTIDPMPRERGSDKQIIIDHTLLKEAAHGNRQALHQLEINMLEALLYESEHVDSLVTQIMNTQGMFAESVPEEEHAEQMARYLKNVLIAYYIELMNLDAGLAIVPTEEQWRALGLPEGVVAIDDTYSRERVALWKSILSVYKESQTAQKGLEDAQEARDYFAPERIMIIEGQLMHAAARFALFERGMHKYQQYASEIEEITNSSSIKEMQAIKRLMSKEKQRDGKGLMIGVSKELRANKTLMHMIEKVLSERVADMVDIQLIMVDDIAQEATYVDMLLASQGDKSILEENPEIASRTFLFQSEKERFAVEIQIFSAVFMMLLDILTNEEVVPEDAVARIFNQSITKQNGFFEVTESAIAQAMHSRIVQEARNQIIRIAA